MDRYRGLAQSSGNESPLRPSSIQVLACQPCADHASETPPARGGRFDGTLPGAQEPERQSHVLRCGFLVLRTAS
jgi:hypothetical protein